jgi:membrane-associated phospholipid phosphatase
MLTSPGYQDGFFYHLVEAAHNAGERPTAAFPSSHVGISTICMLAIWHTRNWKLFAFTGIIYIFLCMATVYIQAHYVIDAIAGFISGIVLYAIMMVTSRKFA